MSGIFKDGAYYPLGTGDDDGMSMGEYEYQYALCNEDYFDPPMDSPSPVPAGKWRVRGGALLEIKDMTKAHLENAIRFFERTGGGARTAKIDELREELTRRMA